MGGQGLYSGDNFDLDIMMPPDIASIDSDISKFLIYLSIRQAKFDDTWRDSKQQPRMGEYS